MIYVVSGDKTSIEQFILTTRKNQKYDTVLRIDSLKNIADFIYAQGLFNNNRLLIIDLDRYTKSESDHVLEIIKVSQEQFVDLIIIDLPIKYLSNLSSKQFIVKDFLPPKDDFAFTLCDSIFVKRNKKLALVSLLQISHIKDEDFYKLIGLIQTYIRLILSCLYLSDAIKSQNRWFASKIQTASANWTIKELQKMLLMLLQLDYKSKSQSAFDYKTLVSDFVLYSF